MVDNIFDEEDKQSKDYKDNLADKPVETEQPLEAAKIIASGKAHPAKLSSDEIFLNKQKAERQKELDDLRNNETKPQVSSTISDEGDIKIDNSNTINPSSVKNAQQLNDQDKPSVKTADPLTALEEMSRENIKTMSQIDDHITRQPKEAGPEMDQWAKEYNYYTEKLETVRHTQEKIHEQVNDLFESNKITGADPAQADKRALDRNSSTYDDIHNAAYRQQKLLQNSNEGLKQANEYKNNISRNFSNHALTAIQNDDNKKMDRVEQQRGLQDPLDNINTQTNTALSAVEHHLTLQPKEAGIEMDKWASKYVELSTNLQNAKAAHETQHQETSEYQKENLTVNRGKIDLAENNETTRSRSHIMYENIHNRVARDAQRLEVSREMLDKVQKHNENVSNSLSPEAKQSIEYIHLQSEKIKAQQQDQNQQIDAAGNKNIAAQAQPESQKQKNKQSQSQQSQDTQAKVKAPSKGLPWKKLGIGFGVALAAGVVFGGPIGVAAVLGCAALAGTGYGIYKATKAITAIGDARQQKSLENNDQKTSKKVQALDKALGKDLEKQQKAELRAEFGKLRTEYNKNIQLLNALNKENNADINADRKSKDEVKKPRALKGIGSDHQKQVNKASIESLHAMRDSLQSNLETVKASVDKASGQLGSERVKKIEANLMEIQSIKNKNVDLPGKEKAAPQQSNVNAPAPVVPKVLSEKQNQENTQNTGRRESHSTTNRQPTMVVERNTGIQSPPQTPKVPDSAKRQKMEQSNLGK